MLDFWLPILVSTIAIFFASFLSWMVFALHEKDWLKIEGEEKLMETISELNIPDGSYMFPGANTAKEMNSPEHQEKFKKGPRGLVQMLPEPNMGKNLGLTMLFFLVCNITFAYLGDFALGADATRLNIFRFIATIALLTFGASIVQHSIWFKNRITGHVIESIMYSIVAGAVFAGLWPAG